MLSLSCLPCFNNKNENKNPKTTNIDQVFYSIILKKKQTFFLNFNSLFKLSSILNQIKRQECTNIDLLIL